MCGIAGIVAQQAQQFEPNLTSMVRSLKHRGPDDDGMQFFKGCGLGHTRLSIVDLACSRQPMLGSDGQTAITFNGEIYGYKALRETLTEYPFRTTGDTEVILALYERHQRNLLRHLPGMFAFAVWDNRQQELFCARDRFGEKPFFYAFGKNKEFIFASEIKAIIASNLVEPVLDRSALQQYLRRGYTYPTQTIYQNIHTLPPAHQLVYQNGKVTIERYWELPKTNEGVSIEAATEQFRHLFDQAVSRQLVADVPVGAFLSGGLDSSTIVAVAARQHPHCKTFSFGFGKSINELPYAREIAERYGTEHIELTDTAENISSLLERMQEVYDEPFGDSSNIPTYLLSKLARQHITVALAGEGSDELTCGYNFWYRPLFNLDHAKGLPDFTATLIRAAAAACKVIGRKLPRSLSELWEGFFMKSHFSSALEAHNARNATFSDSELNSFGLTGYRDLSQVQAGENHGLDAVLRSDVQGYLAGDILAKTDRASMASGLEIRCPFLDVDFASFCISLPTRLKINSQTEKLILREAYAEAWTPAIRRRGKQGFGAPVGDWLKRPEMKMLKNDLFNKQSRIFEYLPAKSVAPYLEKDNNQTWLLLVLALWMQKHTAANPT